MADGVTLETGASAVLLVEMDSRNAHVPAPIPLRLMVEQNVLDLIKRQSHVIMVHALVRNRLVICTRRFNRLELYDKTLLDGWFTDQI